MLARVEDERARTGSAVLEGQEQERARLARDLHDECNQALTGILLRLEALGQRVDPETREELRTIKELTTVAMDELLRLARELRPTALDDHGIRVSLQAQIERFATTTGIVAQLHLDEGAAATLTELTEQEQIVVYRIVQEAMSNVAQHAEARNVAVTISRGPNHEPMVTIRDDGRGIDPAHLKRIFDPFFTTRLGQGGSGLGLHIVHNIVTGALGGQIEVRSEPGEGAVFVLHLPVKAPAFDDAP